MSVETLVVGLVVATAAASLLRRGYRLLRPAPGCPTSACGSCSSGCDTPDIVEMAGSR